MTTIGDAVQKGAHGRAVAAMRDHQGGSAHDRIVRRVVEHDGVMRRRKFVRRDDAAGRSDDVNRQIRQRIESTLDLIDVALLEAGAEADHDKRGSIVLGPWQRGRHREFFVFEHRPDVADHLPAGERRCVEFAKARRDDAVARPPQIVKRRQAGKTGLLPHAVEDAKEPAPHVELTKHEGVDENRRGPSELPEARANAAGNIASISTMSGASVATMDWTCASTAGEVR